MKTIILIMLFFTFSFSRNTLILPILGVNVVHEYSNGEKENIKIEREEFKECLEIAISAQNFQSENLASKKIDKKCKKTFVTTKGMIQALKIHKDVETFGELEVLNFIVNKKADPNKYILVDSRRKEWFDMGTIPSSINIPYDEFEYDEDFKEEYERAYKLLGVKIPAKDKYDFSKAKTALFFCNGSWCAQSPRAIKHLIKLGYPKEKIKWYRGGIAAWAGVSLKLTKKLEAK